MLSQGQLCVNTTFFAARSSSGTVDFKFYDLLEQILDKQPCTSSTLVTDSIEISEDSNGGSVTETGEKEEKRFILSHTLFYSSDMDKMLRFKCCTDLGLN